MYLLGGEDGTTYDDTQVTAYLPYVDAKQPATKKMFTGLDMASEGVWQVQVASNPVDQDALQTVAYVEETTFDKGNVAFQVTGTHMAIKLISQNDGYAKLGAILVHFEGGDKG
jgi:hypothetical protein